MPKSINLAFNYNPINHFYSKSNYRTQNHKHSNWYYFITTCDWRIPCINKYVYHNFLPTIYTVKQLNLTQHKNKYNKIYTFYYKRYNIPYNLKGNLYLLTK